MEKIDRIYLRLQFKRDTGYDAFQDGNYLNQHLRHPYFSWMEEKLLEKWDDK